MTTSMAGGLVSRGGTIRWLLVAATVGLALALTTPRADAYVNPFSQGSWSPGRIDMGVDMIPDHREPIRAIGAAKILGSTSQSGWPGGRYLWYQLISGSHKGEVVYVAEHLRKLVPAGRRVDAGQRVATALPDPPGSRPAGRTSTGPREPPPVTRRATRPIRARPSRASSTGSGSLTSST